MKSSIAILHEVFEMQRVTALEEFQLESRKQPIQMNMVEVFLGEIPQMEENWHFSNPKIHQKQPIQMNMVEPRMIQASLCACTQCQQ